LARAKGINDFIAACAGTWPRRTASWTDSGTTRTRASRRLIQLSERCKDRASSDGCCPCTSISSRSSHASSSTDLRRLASKRRLNTKACGSRNGQTSASTRSRPNIANAATRA
jgi:hypothetical protein